MPPDNRRSILVAIFLLLDSCGVMLIVASAGGDRTMRTQIILWVVAALMVAPSAIYMLGTMPFWPVDPKQDEDDEPAGP